MLPAHLAEFESSSHKYKQVKVYSRRNICKDIQNCIEKSHVNRRAQTHKNMQRDIHAHRHTHKTQPCISGFSIIMHKDPANTLLIESDVDATPANRITTLSLSHATVSSDHCHFPADHPSIDSARGVPRRPGRGIEVSLAHEESLLGPGHSLPFVFIFFFFFFLASTHSNYRNLWALSLGEDQ